MHTFHKLILSNSSYQGTIQYFPTYKSLFDLSTEYSVCIVCDRLSDHEIKRILCHIPTRNNQQLNNGGFMSHVCVFDSSTDYLNISVSLYSLVSASEWIIILTLWLLMLHVDYIFKPKKCRIKLNVLFHNKCDFIFVFVFVGLFFHPSFDWNDWWSEYI